MSPSVPVPALPLEWLLGLLTSRWVVAVGLVLVAWFGSKLLADRLRDPLQSRVLRPSVTNAVLLAARITVVIFALAPIAGLLGVRPRNVLLSVTVLSVVVGAILAPAARSYVAGFFILMNRPYGIGDMIELADPDGKGGQRGYVENVTLRYTKLLTLENAFLVVPNETMRERDVKNLSGEDERSRTSIEVCVTYESDLEAARTLLERAARNAEGVVAGGPDVRIGSVRYPAGPRAFVADLDDHGIVLDVRYWIDAPYRRLAVHSRVRRNVLERVDSRDVEIAYPHTHHVFDETSGRVPVALESAPVEAADRPVDVPGRTD